jgi:hypothetical protein
MQAAIIASTAGEQRQQVRLPSSMRRRVTASYKISPPGAIEDF